MGNTKNPGKPRFTLSSNSITRNIVSTSNYDARYDLGNDADMSGKPVPRARRGL